MLLIIGIILAVLRENKFQKKKATFPLCLLLSVCGCGCVLSLEFMLPVGTPPNAIAYSSGRVKIREMIKAGFLLDILGALITLFLALTLWTVIS